jgi:hypothetical protein
MTVKKTAKRLASRAAVRLDPLVRKPRHGWFAHVCLDAEDGWLGPYRLMEEAARTVLLDEPHATEVWLAQGRKLRKHEIEEMGVGYTYEVDTRQSLKLVLPNRGISERDNTAGK